MREIPAVLTKGPFRSVTATEVGVSWKVLQSRRFRRLLPDVYLHAEVPLTLETWLVAVLLLAPPDAVVSGVSAARLWGFDPAGHDVLDVSTRESSRTTTLPGVVLHRHWGEIPSVVRDGLPVTTPARTVVDCARRLGHVQLVQLVEHLLRTTSMHLGDLADLAHHRPWHGVVRTRRALLLVREGAESPRETTLRLMLVLARLPEPRVNVTIVDALGVFVARVDLLLEEWKVVVEYDGSHHDTDPRQRQRDRERREQLEALGYRVIVVTAVDLRRPHLVVRRVHAALVLRGYDGPAPVMSAVWHGWFPTRP